MFIILAVFNRTEQVLSNEHYMKLIEQEILNQALVTLQEKVVMSPIKHQEVTNIGSFDAKVQILGIDFLCIIKTNVRTSNLNSLLQQLKQDKSNSKDMPILLIAKYISPNVFDELIHNDINRLDRAGNCHIRYMQDKHIVFQLSNKGEKNQVEKESTYPVFKEAGIKVIFYLLQNSHNVNLPYRSIQEATNVSLGTIKNVINKLIAQCYILVTSKGRFMKNQKALLDQWVISYHQVLKPTLGLSNMSFKSPDHKTKWKDIVLPKGMFWSGEPGANLIDAYLEPGQFDIYTEVPSANLMRTGFVKPENPGDIHLLEKFWKWEAADSVAPIILIYADLMGSGNSRCIEMAKRLLKNELNNFN